MYVSLFTDRFYAPFYGLRQRQFISDVLLNNCYIKPKLVCDNFARRRHVGHGEAYFWELPFSGVHMSAVDESSHPPLVITRSPVTREAIFRRVRVASPPSAHDRCKNREWKHQISSPLLSSRSPWLCGGIFVFLFTFRLPS